MACFKEQKNRPGFLVSYDSKRSPGHKLWLKWIHLPSEFDRMWTLRRTVTSGSRICSVYCGARETDSWDDGYAMRPDDLSVLSRIHTVEGEGGLQQVAL